LQVATGQKNKPSPELLLWLACLKDAVGALREKRFGNNTPAKAYARDFLFADHPFFEMLCDSLRV